MSAGLPSSAGASAASTAAPAQTALPRGLVDAGVRVSAAALLAPANCRAPEKTPPSQQTPASVTREHLHLHLRSAPRRAQERVDLLPAHGPCQALAPLQGQRPARANPALAENPRAPARSERSPACRPLGGRSHQGRQQRQCHRRLGRAHHAFGAAGQAASSPSGYGSACTAGIQRQAQGNSWPHAQNPDL